jgi:hypothetical protein
MNSTPTTNSTAQYPTNGTISASRYGSVGIEVDDEEDEDVGDDDDGVVDEDDDEDDDDDEVVNNEKWRRKEKMPQAERKTMGEARRKLGIWWGS